MNSSWTVRTGIPACVIKSITLIAMLASRD
jgi:hypothetical protein